MITVKAGELEDLGTLLAQAHSVLLLMETDENFEDVANNAAAAARGLVGRAREMLIDIEGTAKPHPETGVVPTAEPLPVHGWCHDISIQNAAVIVNPDAPVQMLVAWAHGQMMQVNQLLMELSSVQEMGAVDLSSIVGVVRHFSEQAEQVLEAAVSKASRGVSAGDAS